jgi:hypothetical protein
MLDTLGNPEAVKKFHANHVEFVGKFESAKKTIHVETHGSLPSKALTLVPICPVTTG